MLKETTLDRREEASEAIVLGLLDAVENDAGITQRHLARELGIALGLANTYFKRCVSKGLLKVADVPRRRYAYYLTPKGFAEKSRLTARYLTVSFDFLRRARSELGEIFLHGADHGITSFVLVGEGDLADVALIMAPRAAVRIAGVIAAERDPERLVISLRDVAFDALVITATDFPQEVFTAAISAFGANCVYAPALLRVRRLASLAKSEVVHD